MQYVRLIAESTLELARREVREAEAHVERQRALIAELAGGGDSNALRTARETLAVFLTTLAAHRVHLAQMLAGE